MLHTTSTNNDFFRSLQALVEHGQTEAEKFCQAIQPLRLELERIGGAVQELHRQLEKTLNKSELGAFLRWYQYRCRNRTTGYDSQPAQDGVGNLLQELVSRLQIKGAVAAPGASSSESASQASRAPSSGDLRGGKNT